MFTCILKRCFKIQMEKKYQIQHTDHETLLDTCILLRCSASLWWSPGPGPCLPGSAIMIAGISTLEMRCDDFTVISLKSNVFRVNI